MFTLQNITWNELSNCSNDMRVEDLNNLKGINIKKDIVLLSIKNVEEWELKITDKKHKIPVMESIKNPPKILLSNSLHKIYTNGILYVQQDSKYKFLCYITYTNHKKIIYLSELINEIYYPIYLNCTLKPSEEIIEIRKNITGVPKSTNSPLTEIEKVLLMNVSKKFYKLFENCSTIKEIYIKLSDIFLETIDPYYMSKILILQTNLLLQNENSVQELN